MNGRGCGNGPEIPVADGVVLQTEIDVQVVEAASGDPVSGAGFRLTGPSYARTPLPAPPTVVRQLPTLDLPTLDVASGDATTDENASDGATTDGAATDGAATVPDVAATVPDVAATTGEEADGGFDISALGSTSDTTYPGTNGSDPDVYDGGAAVTGEDGTLVFTGWFAPGNWTLTPIAVPDGYDPPAVASVTVG